MAFHEKTIIVQGGTMINTRKRLCHSVLLQSSDGIFESLGNIYSENILKVFFILKK